MSKDFQIRLKEVARECGGNRALCEKSGVSERTFANWLAGTAEPKIIGLAAIAKAGNVTIDWIVNGTLPKQRLGSHQKASEDTVEIALLDNQLLSDEQPLSERLSIIGHVPFSAAFLKRMFEISQFDSLCVLQASGDSMKPTMSEGDIILVDRGQNHLRDGVVAFVFDDTVHIKRLVNTLNGIDVISDNKDLYPAYQIDGADKENLDVIGRVLWVGRAVD